MAMHLYDPRFEWRNSWQKVVVYTLYPSVQDESHSREVFRRTVLIQRKSAAVARAKGEYNVESAIMVTGQFGSKLGLEPGAARAGSGRRGAYTPRHSRLIVRNSF